MVRRLLMCSLTSIGLLCSLATTASAQVRPVALDENQTEDVFDQYLSSPASASKSKASSAPLAKPALPGTARVGARPNTAPPRIAAGEGATLGSPATPVAPAPSSESVPVTSPALAPYMAVGCAPGAGCLPPMPYSPGLMTPPSDPGLAPPMDPGTPSAPSSAGEIPAPETSPMVDPVAPSPFTPPSNIPSSNQSAFDFSSGFNSQNLLASRDVPAMIGDFFGTGGFTTTSIVADNFFVFDDIVFSDPTVLDPAATAPLVASNDAAAVWFVTRDLNSAPLGSVAQAGPASFTTVVSESAVVADLLVDPSAAFQIQDNGDAAGAAQAGGEALVGPGRVVFRQDQSDTVILSGRPTIISGPNGSVDTFEVDGWEPVWNYDYVIDLIVPGGDIISAPGSNVGRVKLTENTSPIPRDRAYINYSYFDNTPIFPGGVNVNRVTPGFEKTFLGGDMSVEVRAPFATTLDSDIMLGGVTNTSTSQFGNLTAYLKTLLYDDEAFALGAGVGVAVPTANDFLMLDARTGRTVVGVDNKSVHLLPYIGGAYIPNNRLFVQSIMQFDVDLNGNDVLASSFADGSPTGVLTNLGNGHDRTYLFFDVSLGYWIPTYLGPISRVAPILEYHLNQSLSDGDTISGAAGNTFYNFGAPGGVSVSNGVAGLVASIRDEATLTVAYATPLGGADQQFDGEVRVMFNWFFGGNQPLRYGPALR